MASGVDLIVIEAPGKLRAVHRCLEALGRRAEVAATLGHLYDNPPTLAPLGMALEGERLVETLRRDAHPGVREHLIRAIDRASRVIIATDPDSEGHVIAQDVADLVHERAPDLPVVRACPHAMTPAGWRQALERLSPLDPEAARPGTARRLLDRLLAFASMKEGDATAVGRVQSALLGLADRGGIPDRAVCLTAPAADGGGAFVGRGVLHGAPVSWELPPLPTDEVTTEPLSGLMNGGDALLALHDQLHMPVGEAASLLQAMYEAGEISYPRASGRGLRSAGAQAVADIARARAVRPFQSALLPRLDEGQGPAHEAVHVVMTGMIERLDVYRPLRLARDAHEAAASVIARQCVEAGVAVERTRPVRAALPAWARDLSWERIGHRPALGWRPGRAPAQRALEPAPAALHAQLAHGLGQPSTWARHAERLAGSGWLSPSHGLSVAGRLQCARVRQALRASATSVAIDGVLRDEALSVRERVVKALAMALDGDETAVGRVLDALEETFDEAPRLAIG